MKKLLNSLLDFQELTICWDDTAWMNIQRSDRFQVDIQIAKYFSHWHIIEEDSGNLETGEIHYFLNVGLKSNRLNRIIKFLQMVESAPTTELGGKFSIMKELKNIRTQEERKIKLKKIMINK